MKPISKMAKLDVRQGLDGKPVLLMDGEVVPGEFSVQLAAADLADLLEGAIEAGARALARSKTVEKLIERQDGGSYKITERPVHDVHE